MTATPWATIAQITALTGVTVTDVERNNAAHVIELYTGLIEEVERADISDRDRYWLKLAVGYEAPWIQEHPDLLAQLDVTAAAQDGQSATYKPDALLLAPLARHALKKLSFRGPRSIVPARVPSIPTNPDSEAFDDALPWVPMR